MGEPPGPRQRLSRAERRAQILTATARAFVRRGGFAATTMDDVAEAAGITRAILYRHFTSKAELYQAAIDQAAQRLHTAATDDGALHDESVPGILHWAADEPDAFRLLFHQAAREPQFSQDIDRLRGTMTEALRPHVDGTDHAWTDWGARLATTTAIEAVMCWLDAGRPDPAQAPARILTALGGVYTAARTLPAAPHAGKSAPPARDT